MSAGLGQYHSGFGPVPLVLTDNMFLYFNNKIIAIVVYFSCP